MDDSHFYILDDGMNPIPCDAHTWVMWREQHELHVFLDTVQRGEMVVEVSTVFLGLNHQWGVGPPLIFETLVFLNEPWYDESSETWWPETAIDNSRRRYSTKAEALAGHAEVLAVVVDLLVGMPVAEAKQLLLTEGKNR